MSNMFGSKYIGIYIGAIMIEELIPSRLKAVFFKWSMPYRPLR